MKKNYSFYVVLNCYVILPLIPVQDEVSTLEDKVDNLSAEFSALSSQVVNTQDKMNELRQQLQSQRQLNQGGEQSKKVGFNAD